LDPLHWASFFAKALTLGFKSSSSQNNNNFNDLHVLGVSQDGPRLVDAIQATKFQGISGEFILVDGQRQASVFEIFNVIGNSYDHIKVLGSGHPSLA
jgi:ionotropic glutamate receptor